jgi:glycosyltransferase involved in cell wall biosynthesis
MNENQPFFSIIIPTYKRPRQLAACMQSLAQLDYSSDCFEVIVVDDGGEIPLEEVTASFGDRLDVRLLRQPNAGPATARNTGAMKARGTFLAFTDDDCRPASDWLMSLAVRFAKDPDCVLGGRTTNALDDNPYSSASQLLIDYLYSYYNANPNQARFFTSNNLALAADRFRAIGGFDTTFPRAGGEDREFCDRWLSQGYRMIYAPHLVTYHAHPLTFRTFLRQHFAYGQGAFSFRLVSARRSRQGIRFEPVSFYLEMLRYPFRKSQVVTALLLAALLGVSQVVNAVGFFWEWGRVRKRDTHPSPAMSVR